MCPQPKTIVSGVQKKGGPQDQLVEGIRGAQSSPGSNLDQRTDFHLWFPESIGMISLAVPSGELLHNWKISPFSMGKTTINGPFSIAMLNYQRVSQFGLREMNSIQVFNLIYDVQELDHLTIQLHFLHNLPCSKDMTNPWTSMKMHEHVPFTDHFRTAFHIFLMLDEAWSLKVRVVSSKKITPVVSVDEA